MLGQKGMKLTIPSSKYRQRVMVHMYGGGMRSILLLPLVNRRLESIDVYMLRMFVFMSISVSVWGSLGMFDR